MSDKIREALEGMLAIHDEPSGFAGKYGRALDEAIAAQKAKIDQRIAAARTALAQHPTPAAVPEAMDEAHAGSSWEASYRAGWNACRAAVIAASPAAPAPEAQEESVAIPERLTYSRADRRYVNGWNDALSHITTPPAAEQPDTVTELRDLMRRYFGALDRFDQEGPASITVAAAKEAEALEKELRALLSGGDKP